MGLATSFPYALCSATLGADLLPLLSSLLFSLMLVSTVPLGNPAPWPWTSRSETWVHRSLRQRASHWGSWSGFRWLSCRVLECRLSWWEVMAAACWGGGRAGARSSPFVSLHTHIRGNVLAWAPGSTRSNTETASLAQGSEGSRLQSRASCSPPRAALPARGPGLAGQTAIQGHEGGLERGRVRGGQNSGNTKGGKSA